MQDKHAKINMQDKHAKIFIKNARTSINSSCLLNFFVSSEELALGTEGNSAHGNF